MTEKPTIKVESDFLTDEMIDKIREQQAIMRDGLPTSAYILDGFTIEELYTISMFVLSYKARERMKRDKDEG